MQTDGIGRNDRRQLLTSNSAPSEIAFVIEPSQEPSSSGDGMNLMTPLGVPMPVNREALADRMKGDAERFVEQAGQRFGIGQWLDYSGRSLQIIDQTLRTFHPEGFLMPTSAIGYGAYVGESFRKLFGSGTWELEGGDGDAMPRLANATVGPEATANLGPFLWVLQISGELSAAADGGDAEVSSIAERYAMILDAVGRRSEIPDPVDADLVRRTHGTHRDGPSPPNA